MNRNFTNISEYLKVSELRKNRRIIVFLICVMIATAMWFLNALSKVYTTTISFPVKFINPPENRFLADKSTARIDLEVEGQGFTLLRFKMMSYAPLSLDVSEITKNLKAVDGNYTISTRNLITTFEGKLNGELSVTNVTPEVMDIVLDRLETKTVPVVLDIKVDFETQFNLKTPIRTVPDKVKITGPTTVLEKIREVNTKVNISTKLNSDIKQEIDLIHPEKTTISPEKVTLIIQVEKYTEKELKIPIEVLHKPEKASIKLFPSELKVLFTVGLSRFESIKASDFGAYVDYNSIVNNVNILNVTLYKKPEFIQGLRFVPEKVEFLVEKN